MGSPEYQHIPSSYRGFLVFGVRIYEQTRKRILFFFWAKEKNLQKFKDLISKFSFNVKLYIPSLINWCLYLLFIMKLVFCYLTINFALLSITQKPVNWFALQQQTDFLSVRRQCDAKTSSGKWSNMTQIKCKIQTFSIIKKSLNP